MLTILSVNPSGKSRRTPPGQMYMWYTLPPVSSSKRSRTRSRWYVAHWATVSNPSMFA